MKEYGDKEDEIQRLKAQIKEIDDKTLKFTEYQKAKKELEFEEMKKSSTFSKFDSDMMKSLEVKNPLKSGR